MALKSGDDGLSLRAILPGRRDLIPTGGEPFLQSLDLAAPVARSKACVSIDGARLSMRQWQCTDEPDAQATGRRKVCFTTSHNCCEKTSQIALKLYLSDFPNSARK
jgi:hypothetical protein